MASAFELLHPGVKRKLWEMKWEELRPIQAQAIQHILGGGGDCVISSPTAGGKTEAAFLPVLSAIADDPMGGVRAMYVGPLKALINDQFGRLEDLCGRMEVPVHKWHGDVGDSERRALISKPGGVILITPESLEAMFVMRAERVAAIFGRLAFVVIDELHAFLGSPRGAQLRSLLHRLRVRAGCDPVRIGLSATIGNPDEALRWIRPVGPRATLIRDTGSGRLKVAVKGIWREASENPDTTSGAKESRDEASVPKEDPAVTELARAILMACRGSTNLVFANAKGHIEELADELTTQAKAMSLRDEIVVHHGSLSKAEREHTESRLREDRPCTAVCSNTLEMGIDIGQIDAVIQVAAPWAVSSLVQRVGRSGRRQGEARVLRGYFTEDKPTSGDDIWSRLHLEFLQGIATVELMLEKFIEPAELKRAHWSTLVQQMLSMLAETGGMKAADLKTRLLDSEAFGALSGADFASLLRNLAKEDLIEQIADSSLVLGLKGQRIVEHFTFFAAFRTPVEFRVVHGAVEIGKLPEMTAPLPGDHVILAAKRWKVERVDPERREIEVVPSKGKQRPKFTSLAAEIHPAVHEKMRALLGSVARPSYLDDVAFEMLSAARQTAAPYRNFQPGVVPSDGRVRLFIWKGSKVQRTILLVLTGAGLRVKDEEVGLEVDAGQEEVRTAFTSFVSQPDGERLAAIAEETMHARLLGGDKFDRYLPSPLWRRAFVAERLDLAGAVAFLRGLLESGGGEPPRSLGSGDESELSPREPPPTGGTAQTLSLRPRISLWSGALADGSLSISSQGAAGTPWWGPDGLLRDLELRLGISAVDVPVALRAQLWALRMDAQAEGAFYARSYAVDPLGTARAVLELRDQLVDAGWNGGPLGGAGPRIEAIYRLEAATGPDIPPGASDRLVAVERALARAVAAPYEELLLCEEEGLWSGRWRRVFAELRRLGSQVTPRAFPLWSPSTRSTATGDSDLRKLQLAIASSSSGASPGKSDVDGPAAGDGSVTILRAETSTEAAEAVAAIVRSIGGKGVTVVLGGDDVTLDGALSVQQVPTMGTTGTSPWRPLQGVLPLAIEMLYEPRDPLQAIDLLMLPGGPFAGVVGWTLSRALAAEPGLGGRRWRSEFERLRTFTLGSARHGLSGVEVPEGQPGQEVIERDLSRVAEWLEGPRYDPIAGAPKTAVSDVIGRVRSWALGRLERAAGSDPEAAAAVRLAHAAYLAVAADAREAFPRDLMRQILWDLRGTGHSRELWPEEAGRVEHVRAPGWLPWRAGTVIWWHFVDGSATRVAPLSWRGSEIEVLSSAGITFAEPRRLQEAMTRAWRHAALAAEGRLLLVVPERCEGEATLDHPFLDEVMVHLGVEGRDLSRITVKVPHLLAGASVGGLASVAADRLDVLQLPTARAMWQVDPALLFIGPDAVSATGLEAVLGCPLKWALRYRARLRQASVADVPPLQRLAGQLGHRLIEELHGCSSADAGTLDASMAPEILDRLIATEGAVLLRPGRIFERAQLRRDLLRAVAGLTRFLAESGFRIVAVEQGVSATWRGLELAGRTDLLLRRSDEELIVDLKWGRSRHQGLLENGHAVQLAAYAFMRASAKGGDWPATGYFSLSRSELLTANGGLAPSVRTIAGAGPRQVWERTSSTLEAVRSLLDSGRLPVTGLRSSLPLLEVAGVADPTQHLALASDAPCEYCDYDALCGRAWQAFGDDEA